MNYMVLNVQRGDAVSAAAALEGSLKHHCQGGTGWRLSQVIPHRTGSGVIWSWTVILEKPEEDET